MTEKSYAISHEIISKYEKELINSLPELYPDEGERQIVEMVLIPEFRLKIQEVFEVFLKERSKSKGRGNKAIDKSVPITEHEMPNLCTAIDKMIEENKQLLAVDDLFKVVFNKVQKIRPKLKEDMNVVAKQKFREAFAEHGIVDRATLMEKGMTWITQTKGLQFPPLGGPHSFLKVILGQSVNDKKKHLEQVADKLGWTEIEITMEEKKQQIQSYKNALAEHGINDRLTLIKKGPTWFFKNTQFTSFGGGKNFIKQVFGQSLDPSNDTLDRLANKIGLPDISDGTRQIIIQTLIINNIKDRSVLLH